MGLFLRDDREVILLDREFSEVEGVMQSHAELEGHNFLQAECWAEISSEGGSRSHSEGILP